MVVVLIGGGHSHALLLLRWARHPMPGVRLVLVSESSESPYSGMLPGWVAGHYQRDDVFIDLRALCRQAGAQFLQARVTGVDPFRQQVMLDQGLDQGLDKGVDLAYDVLSINCGAIPDLSVPGAAEHSIPVKPIAHFWRAWEQQREQLQRATVARSIAAVGGGAGSVELVLAMAHALRSATVRHRFHLVARGERLLPEYPAKMVMWMQKRLRQYAIDVHLQSDVVQVMPDQVRFANGATLATDAVFWCTQARGADWLSHSHLDVTENGFVHVQPTLQTLRWPNIFAAGDCAWMDVTPTARAGVYAVRQAPFLNHNLRAFLQKKPLKPYHPQRTFLSLLAMGDRDAVGARGGISLAGRWLWHWKDHIDRRFMNRLMQRLR